MATPPVMFNVVENFDVQTLGFKLRDLYASKGFNAVVLNAFGPNITLRLEQGVGGINALLGNCKGITVNITLQGNMLIVNYTDAEWTSKITALVVGFFLCLIPFVTGIIGSIGQNNLPGEITRDITMLLNTVGTVPPYQG